MKWLPAVLLLLLSLLLTACGSKKGVAEKIAKVTDADVYEIVPAEPYTSDDLDYNDKSSRSTKEQNYKSARPAIGSEKIELSGYKTIYIGFPVWWGEEPRIMDTFVENYDFSGEDDNTSDYISEALMKSVVHSFLIAIENPDDTMHENEECK